MAKYKNYYVGCSDPFGKNPVEDFLNKTIAEVCTKYKMKEKDYDIIAKAFIEACNNSYFNGDASNEFDHQESEGF